TMPRPARNLRSKWDWVSNVAAANKADGQSALQHADQSIGKAEPFRHHPNHVSEQSLAQSRLFLLDAFECTGVELIKHACGFGLNGRAAGRAGDQAHFADRGVAAEAAHPRAASI